MPPASPVSHASCPLQAGFYKAQDKLTGDVLVNGKAVTKEKMRRISGFVHQEVRGAGGHIGEADARPRRRVCNV